MKDPLFITDQESKNSLLRDRLGTFLNAMSFGFIFKIFYELLSINHYHSNKIRLLRYLRENRVMITHSRDYTPDDADVRELRININGNEYFIWYHFKENKISLYKADLINGKYKYGECFIGLFTECFHSKYLNSKIIKFIK